MSGAYIVKNVTIAPPDNGVVSRFYMDNNLDNKTGAAGLTIRKISAIVEGTVICGQECLDEIIRSACGCDLMSDVLAFTRPGSVLLTGLTNAQVIRTAEMLDLKAIVFVRDKRPDERTTEMAREMGIAIILTSLPLYESCARLYAAGLPGCQDSHDCEPHPATGA